MTDRLFDILLPYQRRWVLDAPAPDPRNTVLVFPLDADGEPTEEALRQFAAIINAADQAEKERTQ